MGIEPAALPTPEEALRPFAEGEPGAMGERGTSPFELPPLTGNVVFDVRVSDEYMREIARQEIQAEISDGTIADTMGRKG
jgi:hypothetical protein